MYIKQRNEISRQDKDKMIYKESVRDICTFKAIETFRNTHVSSCHVPGVTKGYIKGKTLRLLSTLILSYNRGKFKRVRAKLYRRGQLKM